MKIGFPKTRRREERRISLLPEHIPEFIEDPSKLFFERGFGSVLGIEDREYKRVGANISGTEKVYSLDGVCQAKFCMDDLIHMDRKGQTVFAWLHLSGGEVCHGLMDLEDTAISWELMKKDGKNVFYDNGIYTGRIGVLHGIAHSQLSPEESRVAIIGRGNVGTGAREQLEQLGARDITVYHSENFHLLARNLGCYDVVVNCACKRDWGQILSPKDLKKLKHGALLIDIGDCVGDGLYLPQSIFSPTTTINGGQNTVYLVNHLPTFWYRTTSRSNSRDVAPYINQLTQDQMDDVLKNATTLDKGKVIPGRGIPI